MKRAKTSAKEPKEMQVSSERLIAAATQGDTASVAALLDAGEHIESRDANGDTALANAALNGHLDMVVLLLRRGANPNATNLDGDTVLMWAASTGRMDICELLLRLGANVNAENKKGYRALYRAVYKDYPNLVKMLLVAGAEPKAVNAHGKTVLDQAQEWQLHEIIDILFAWQTLDGCEMIKREFPETASNFVRATFVSGKELAARHVSPPRQRAGA